VRESEVKNLMNNFKNLPDNTDLKKNKTAGFSAGSFVKSITLYPVNQYFTIF